MSALIRITKGKGKREQMHRLSEGKTVTIGRGDHADLVLSDAFASRIHCAIECEDGEFVLSDMGSGNGTRVNGEPITRHVLQVGDKIVVGRTQLRFSVEAEQAEVGGEDPLEQATRRFEEIDSALKAGKTWRIGGCMLLKKIGLGGMGAVYRAVRESDQATVAVKILAPKVLAQKTVIERFKREARSAAELDHPNVVAAFDLGEEQGLYYFTMEYVDGPTVGRTMRKRKRIPEPDAIRVALDVVAALEHASHIGLVHRDVKPDNIMVTRAGKVKLCDFGLSKPLQYDGPALTAPGLRVGTPSYMAPEQIQSTILDSRSDIYSLGATVFHLVTGQRPFPRKSSFEVMAAHVKDPLPHPRSLNPKLSEGFCAVIFKMMTKDLDDRYQTFKELSTDLKLLQAELDPVHAPIMPIDPSDLPLDVAALMAAADAEAEESILAPIDVQIEESEPAQQPSQPTVRLDESEPPPRDETNSNDPPAPPDDDPPQPARNEPQADGPEEGADPPPAHDAAMAEEADPECLPPEGPVPIAPLGEPSQPEHPHDSAPEAEPDPDGLAANAESGDAPGYEPRSGPAGALEPEATADPEPPALRPEPVQPRPEPTPSPPAALFQWALGLIGRRC